MTMTDNKAQEALKLYLKGDIGIDALEERVISLAWDAEFEEQHLIDQVAIELSYLKDGASDESAFRARVAKIAAPPTQDAIIAVGLQPAMPFALVDELIRLIFAQVEL